MKALIVYGTRSGATRAIAEEISKALAEQGYETTVRNARDSKGLDVKAADLVVVGSSVWATMWTSKSRGFLKRNQGTLANKKVALFSSGLAGNDPAQADYASQSIASVAAKFPGIQPLSTAYFGGYLDFNSSSLVTRIIGGAMKKDLAKKGVDTSKPYDTRDFPAIHKWAREVAEKAR